MARPQKQQSELNKALISAEHTVTVEEAEAIIDQMRSAVSFEGEDPEEVLLQYGLEPDYIFDILSY